MAAVILAKTQERSTSTRLPLIAFQSRWEDSAAHGRRGMWAEKAFRTR